ncbi:conserved hypothetical protein, partial [Ricinus communis]
MDAGIVVEQVAQRPAAQPVDGLPGALERVAVHRRARPHQRHAVHAQQHLAHDGQPAGRQAQRGALLQPQRGHGLAQHLHLIAPAGRGQSLAQRARRAQPRAQAPSVGNPHRSESVSPSDSGRQRHGVGIAPRSGLPELVAQFPRAAVRGDDRALDRGAHALALQAGDRGVRRAALGRHLLAQLRGRLARVQRQCRGAAA